ncbi:MAG: response regulator [Thermodesulfobacteriota bacterium]|nr:response regulator [Thermodesulfobacteriota bacterium]
MIQSILGIDDDTGLLRAMARIFQSSGACHFETADNGIKGLELFDRRRFDLVITDILMPGLDGRDVARYVKRTTRGAVPVIGMSGTPGLATGWMFDAVLYKPFDTWSLKQVLRDFGIFL